MSAKADPNDVIAKVSNNEPDTEYPLNASRFFHTAINWGIIEIKESEVPTFIKTVTMFMAVSS